MTKRFDKIKKDGTCYVRDNRLNINIPMHEINSYAEYYGVSADCIIEKLNQENKIMKGCKYD